MKTMRKILVVVAVCCAVAVGAQAAGECKHALTFDDLIKLQRVAEAANFSGREMVTYTVAMPDMEANRNASNIWPCADGCGRRFN